MAEVYWSLGRILVPLAHNSAEIVDELALCLKLIHFCSVLLLNIIRRTRIESCVHM